MIQPATQLIALLREPGTQEQQANVAAQAVLKASQAASPGDIAGALTAFAGALPSLGPMRAAFLAVICGCLIERGADPAPVQDVLLQRLRELLPRCTAFVDRCRAEMGGTDGASDEGKDAEEDADEQEEQFGAVAERLAPAHPDEAAAWSALEFSWPSAIALFSTSASARAQARDLREPAGHISEFHPGGHWIELILSVLADEPLLVIEPSTRLGLSAKMTGVVDNFQLNMLLMDSFPTPDGKPQRRISRQAADIARGLGPQSIQQTVTGAWNLYTCQALRPDRTLPGGMESDHWVWNEGRPEDIPVFEAHRVVLLGPAAYSRGWRAQRMYAALRADLANLRLLTPAEVDDWLSRIAASHTSA
jgi:hypothetical protein